MVPQPPIWHHWPPAPMATIAPWPTNAIIAMLASHTINILEKKLIKSIRVPTEGSSIDNLKSYTAQVVGRKKHDDCTMIPFQVEIQHLAIN